MIDHVLGRPSVRFRKIQVLAVVSFWSFYLFRGDKHGPPTIRSLSRRLSGLFTPWQTVVITLLYLYIAKNFGKLVGLESPEPLANLYTRSYFRATWVTTAMDAGFWTAMRIRRKWMRDIASIVFTFYYLVAAEQADEKVRKVRSMLTVDHLRVSWNKGTTPYLRFVQNLMRPRLMRYPPRAIRIPRPPNSDYTEPVSGWLYFDGPLSALKNHNKVVLDIPGGGFVAMDPRTHDDKLFGWAGKTGLPVLSLDYKKAPEFPYPYALNECYDVYSTIVASKGRCVGLSGEVSPRVVFTGDSAGGNLAVSTVLMIIESGLAETRQYQGEGSLPLPEGVVLAYPALDMNIGNWMSDEQMSLIKDRQMRATNKNIIKRKSMQYNMAAGTPHASGEELDYFSHIATSPPIEDEPSPEATSLAMAAPSPMPLSPRSLPDPKTHQRKHSTASLHPEPLKTRLAMSSMISYFEDRILTPEMMRAMIILYIGPHNRPDFSTDYHLSPVLAPDSLLALFPKTYFLTGERDPLVDDTVIFAGRIRRAKLAKYDSEQANRIHYLRKEFDDRDHVEVTLVPSISHGFLQFAGVYPEGWKYIYKCARWVDQIYADAEEKDRLGFSGLMTPSGYVSTPYPEMSSILRRRAESSGEEDMGLEMSMSRRTKSKPQSTKPHDPHGERKQKERLLREEMDLRREGGRKKTVEDVGSRKKSLVSLASTEDLLGRRMLGLAGPLTGRGDGDVSD